MPTKIVAADGSGDFLNMEGLRLHISSISVAITEPFIVQIKGTVDCATASFGYPPGISAANYLRFEGVTGTNPKITNANNPTQPALQLGVQHLRLLNITLESNSSALALAGTGSASGYTLYIENTKILQPNTTASPNYTVQANPAVVLFRNVLFVGKVRGIDFRPAITGDVKVLNSTFWLTSGDYPALLHANTKVYNSYAGNAGTSTKDWLLASGKLTNGSNNASKDTTATTITTVAGIGGVGSSAFTDTANYDFSLAVSSPLIDAGTTLAENTTDINGVTRPQGAAYDIGAYEMVSGGGTAPTGTVTIGTITKTATTATIPYTYSDADQTGFEYRLNGGTPVADAASPVDLTGLTASNAYAIEVRAVNASGAGAWSAVANFTTDAAVTPIAFTGTIPNQTFTNGLVVSVNLATYFSGTQTPFSFANTGTSLTGTGLSISSAGVLSGTATTGSATGVICTGTDASSNTASSNAFNVTVNPSGTPVSFAGTIPTLSGTQNVAITPVDTSTYFSGTNTPFTYSLQAGTLPAGVTLNNSTGVISGTPMVSFTGSVTVRATDTSSATADSNSFSVEIAAAPVVGTITLTDLASNNGTLWASASVDAVTVMPVSLGSVVVNKTGLTTTAGADLVVTDAAIVAGTDYVVGIKIGTAYGIVKVTAT